MYRLPACPAQIGVQNIVVMLWGRQKQVGVRNHEPPVLENGTLWKGMITYSQSVLRDFYQKCFRSSK
jgi:hypothetical protein